MFFLGKKREVSLPYKREIKKINEEHKKIENKCQVELINLIEDIKESNEPEDFKTIQSYAILKEVIHRTLGMVPYDVQIAGGLALKEGNIAQMKTGEGKTITALFPAIFGYVSDKKTYIVTVNEYLVERDWEQAKLVFEYLAIDVGLVISSMQPCEKREQYKMPVTYTTNSEFAFDYLRDNLIKSTSQRMQGDFDFVVLDEADLILVDEAKNPVIISENSMEKVPNIIKAREFIQFISEDDYEIDEETQIPLLTEDGYEKASQFLGYEVVTNQDMYHAIIQALFAEFKFKRDEDYVVSDDGEIMLVDKFTGRVLDGRRLQNGLHQAIEYKEDVEIKPENMAVASTTYQSLFRKFNRLSGMTGTGIESKSEFKEVYKTDVVVIPTNKPVLREDKNDIMFETKEEKYKYLVSEVLRMNKIGQPVLIGTISVKESEEVAEYLDKEKISYQLLNAKNDKNEAEIISKAGEKNSVTIATNMAGRGTDIKLTKEVEALGGLCVLSASRNESKRIDRQLQGRSGRQGQVGESQFLTSLEDELLVVHGGEKLEKFKKKNKSFPIKAEIATKFVDDIQNTLDSKSQSIRKMQCQMDEILHCQREFVYAKRNQLLENGFDIDIITGDLEKKVELIARKYLSIENTLPELEEIKAMVDEKYDISLEIEESEYESGIEYELLIDRIEESCTDFVKREDIEIFLRKNPYREMIHSLESQFEIKTGIDTGDEMDYFKCSMADISKQIAEAFREKLDEIVDESLFDSIQILGLDTIDRYWMYFLQEVEIYKQGFAFASMGEQDPMRKFAFDMDDMFKNIMAEAYLDFAMTVTDLFAYNKAMNMIEHFTIYPYSPNYNFPLEKIEGITEGDLIRVEVFGHGKKIEEVEVVVNEKKEVFLSFASILTTGNYAFLFYKGEELIHTRGIEVSSDIIDYFESTRENILVDLPLVIRRMGEDSGSYRAVLKHTETGNSFEFEFPKHCADVMLNKPESQSWKKGAYTLSIYDNDLHLVEKEFEVFHPKKKSITATVMSREEFEALNPTIVKTEDVDSVGLDSSK